MRRVVVLAEAAEDIGRPRDFYGAQESGIGGHCADSLVADIASLALYHGIHSRHLGFYRMLAHRSRSEFIIVKPKLKPRCSPCWICAAIPIGFAKS